MADEPFFVVAPSYQWFVDWCQDHNINPRDKRRAIFMREVSDVQGYHLSSEEQIIDLGDLNPKRYDIVLALKSRILEISG